MSTVDVAPIESRLLDARPQRSGRAVSVVSAYLIACLLCFALAYAGISRHEAASLRFLNHSTFLYTSTDHASAALATQLNNRLHIQTLNLLSLGAGGAVYRLTGTHEATSPTLIIPTQGGLEVLSGATAVNQALQPFSPQESLYQKAKWALAFMAGLIILAIIFEAELSAVTAYLPLLGLVAIGALWGRCLHCSAGGSMLSTLAPVLGLVYLGGGGAVHLAGPSQARVLPLLPLCFGPCPRSASPDARERAKALPLLPRHHIPFRRLLRLLPQYPLLFGLVGPACA